MATADRGGAVQLQQLPSTLEMEADELAPPIRWMAHTGRALCVATIPGGRGVVSGGRDGMLRVWTPDFEATRWYTFRHADPMTMSVGQNKRLYVAGHKIFVWDIQARRLVDTFAESEPTWSRIACSADGNCLAAVRPGQLILFDLGSLRVVRQWKVADDASDTSFDLAVSKDGRWVALAEANEQDYVSVYDRDRPQWLQRLPAKQCYCVAFSPEGRWLAAGHMDDLRLFDFRSGSEPHIIKGHTSTLSDVDFSPDGRLLASVCPEIDLGLWRAWIWAELMREDSRFVAIFILFS